MRGWRVDSTDFRLNLANLRFDLGHTLDSGQAFRWVQKGEWWHGVLPGGPIKVRQEEAALVCVAGTERLTPQSVHSYFRLDDDLERVYSRIMKDDHMTEAVQRYYGLRLIQQDVWECLVSFGIATNTNIPRIRLMISRLCESIGERVASEEDQYSLFPRPETLPDASGDGSASMREYFGEYAGYAQQYLFHDARKSKLE